MRDESNGHLRKNEATLVLLERARAGDEKALEILYGRYLDPLERWARGRLPAWARGRMDTQDVVQEAVLGSLRRVKDFDPRRTGAFQSYLRTSVLNQIRDELRRTRRSPPAHWTTSEFADSRPSPVELAIGRERLARYEAALALLAERDREVVIARIELEFSFQEIADALGKPTAAAARAAFTRAVLRLIKIVDELPKTD